MGHSVSDNAERSMRQCWQNLKAGKVSGAGSNDKPREDDDHGASVLNSIPVPMPMQQGFSSIMPSYDTGTHSKRPRMVTLEEKQAEMRERWEQKQTGARKVPKKKAKRRKRPPTPKQLAKRVERRRKQKARWAKKVRKLRAIEKRKAASAVSKAERAEKERLKEERRQERHWQWRLKHHKEVVEAEKAKAFQEGYQLGLEVGRGQASFVQG